MVFYVVRKNGAVQTELEATAKNNGATFFQQEKEVMANTTPKGEYERRV